MEEAKCAQCGTIHLVLSESDAMRFIDDENTAARSEGRPTDASVESYRQCSVCGETEDRFVAVEIGDIRSGRSVPIVIRDKSSSQAEDVRNFDSGQQIRTYLNVPNEMVSYAKRHGAYFDKEQRRFYVLGEVPSDLCNLLPKEEVKRPYIVPPSCPKCGFHTELIKNTKSGAWFYGCSRYRSHGCKGSVDYDKHLIAHGEATETTAFSSLKKVRDPEITKRVASGRSRLGVSVKYQEAFADVVKLGVDILGSPAQFKKWLTERKVGLGGRTPTDVMKTLQGCGDVKKILLSMRE